MIKMYLDERTIEDCTSVIIVPEKALAEAGYIQALTERNDTYAKHEFHAMAQTAYFQFQDDELVVHEVTGEIRISSGEVEEVQGRAMIIYRDGAGSFHVYMHKGLRAKKLLEAAYRFCTRWVRLDI